MKYLLVIIAVLFINFSMLAQRIIRVDSNILLHTVIDSLRFDFKTKAEAHDKNVLHTLNTRIVYLNHDTFQVFFPAERAIALFLTGNYPTLLSDVMERFDYHYFSRTKDFKRKKINFPTVREYKEEFDVLNELNKELETVVLKINSTNLKEDERQFLLLYLNSILAFVDLRKFDTEQMIKECETFLNRHPDSRYREYVEKVLYIRLKTMDFGIGAGVFTGYNFMGGNINDYFRNYISVGPTLEIGFKKLLLKGEMAPSFSRHLKQTFVYENNSWTTDSTPFVINGNANLAYVLHETEKFRCTPYIGIGTHGIRLTDNADNMLFSTNLNYGIELDWKFAADNTYGTYYETFNSVKDNTNWHLRFRLGYSQFKNADERFTGSLIYTKVEIGFYSNPAKRLKYRTD